MKWSRVALLVTTALVVFALGVGPIAAETPGVVLSTTYPSVVADKGKQLTFPIEVVNRTQDFQQVDLQIASGPADWQPDLKDRGFSIRRVMLAPNKSQQLDFQAKPPETAKAGEYAFLIKALAPGGSLFSDLRLVVTLRESVSSGLKLSTQFPNIRGQAGTFSFKFDLTNEAGVDRDVSLAASAPRGWEVVFKPSFESKQVSTFRVKAGATQGVDVEITTPQRTDAGEYKVVIGASADADKVEVPLNIVIVGQSKLSLDTQSGQLNTRATIDQDTKLTLVVKNTGSAALKNIAFASSRPDGWNVTFDPERIDDLAVGQQVEITATIRPSSRALAGDYMLSMTATAPGASDSRQIRVTVETPTLWGWIAVAAIVAVLGGLGTMFVRLSRR